MARLNLDKIYRDQAIENFRHPGIQIASFYTPEGIRRIDSRFCHRIRAFKRGESYTEYRWSYWSPYSDEPKRPPMQVVEQVWTDTHESLTKDINDCPHLHSTIKENLLFNLNQ